MTVGFNLRQPRHGASHIEVSRPMSPRSARTSPAVSTSPGEEQAVGRSSRFCFSDQYSGKKSRIGQLDQRMPSADQCPLPAETEMARLARAPLLTDAVEKV